MKTISLKEFTDNFMQISNNLTNAEMRLLYLFITEPDVIKLSQQQFADKIGTHRRTIWLGIKKLQKLNYISGINVNENGIEKSDNNITNAKSDKGDTNITFHDIEETNYERNRKYETLLYEYEIYNEDKKLIQLFEDFPDNYPMTLISIRDNLPKNIDSIAKKFGFEDKLRIIKISRRELNKLRKEKKLMAEGHHEFIDEFFKYKSKTKRTEIVRQFLIYHPFEINKLIEWIGLNDIEKFTELIEIMVKHLYGIELSQLIQWSIK